MEDIIINVARPSGSTCLVDAINGNYGKRGMGVGGLSIWGASSYKGMFLDYSAGPVVTMGPNDAVLHSMQFYLCPNGSMDFLSLPDEPIKNPVPDNPAFRFDVFDCQEGTLRWNDAPLVQSFVYEHTEWEIEVIPWGKTGKVIKQYKPSLFTVYFDPVVLRAHQRYFFAWNPDDTEKNYRFIERLGSVPVQTAEGVVLDKDCLVRWVNFNKRNETSPDWLYGVGGLSTLYPAVMINV